MDFKLILVGAKCTWCEECSNACPTGALNHVDGLLSWDKNKCSKCETCYDVCTNNAMEVCWV